MEVRGVFDAIDRFIQDFTWKRVAVWGMILGLIGATVALYEWYTNDFRIARISKQIEVFKSLQEASPATGRDTALVGMYETLRTQLRASVQQGAHVPSVIARWLHGSLGFFPWAGMTAVTLAQPEEEREENLVGGSLVILIIGVAAGWLITLLPSSWPGIVTHIAAPLALPAAVLILFSIFSS